MREIAFENYNFNMAMIFLFGVNNIKVIIVVVSTVHVIDRKYHHHPSRVHLIVLAEFIRVNPSTYCNRMTFMVLEFKFRGHDVKPSSIVICSHYITSKPSQNM